MCSTASDQWLHVILLATTQYNAATLYSAGAKKVVAISPF